MRVIPLSNAANQSFTVTLDGVRWVIRLVSCIGCMAADISRDGVELLRGVRVLAGEPVIPYPYLISGNFVFIVNGDQLPEAAQFGVSQFLVYLDQTEIAALAADPPTVNDLDPFVPSFLIDDNGFYLTTDAGEILTDD